MDSEGEERARYKSEYYLANKEKQDALTRAWALENKEKMREYSAKSKEKHREKNKARRLEIYQLNKEKVAERMRLYYQKNAEACRARRLAYRAANLEKEREKDRNFKREHAPELLERRRQRRPAIKDKLNAASRAYGKAHPEIIAHHAHKRRALIRGATIGNPEVIIAWMSRWRNAPAVRCYWCQEIFPGNKCVLDHVISLKRKGWHEIGNVCTSCRPCNSKKGYKTLEAWNKLIKEPVLF